MKQPAFYIAIIGILCASSTASAADRVHPPEPPTQIDRVWCILGAGMFAGMDIQTWPMIPVESGKADDATDTGG